MALFWTGLGIWVVLICLANSKVGWKLLDKTEEMNDKLIAKMRGKRGE